MFCRNCGKELKEGTAICPECGRTYISGGTTTTKIKYPSENNPYQKNMKNLHKQATEGMNFDAAV